MAETKDKSDDSGAFTRIFTKDGRMSAKVGALLLLMMAGGSFGGGMLSLKSMAPDPEVVKATAQDVSSIKTSLSNLELSLRHALDGNSRDRVEWDRRFDEQRKQIDKLELALAAISNKSAKVDELDRRVTQLENRK